MNQSYSLSTTVVDQKKKVKLQVQERKQQQKSALQAEIEQEEQITGKATKLKELVQLPKVITQVEQLDRAIKDFQGIRNKVSLYGVIEVAIEIEDLEQE